MVRVVWDRGALCGYEGFCGFAFGLCGLWVDVWGWEWLASLDLLLVVSGMGKSFAYMGATRGLSLLRAWWATYLEMCPCVIAMDCCCHLVAGRSVGWTFAMP